MEEVLVIGLGSVGKALLKIVSESRFYKVSGLDKEKEIVEKTDIIHICYPYSDNFIKGTISYIDRFCPKLVIIESTVLPGTTRKIHEKTNAHVCHSPIRGQHNNLYRDIKRYSKYVGAVNRSVFNMAREHFERIGIKVNSIQQPEYTELIKLLDVCQYGILIAWAQEAEKICKRFGVSHDLLRDFGEETQKLYGLRPDIYPPREGIKGCVWENATLLREIENSNFLDLIIEIGKGD